jgi:hypothetical protein
MAHRAFEEEGVIGELQRVAMVEVDLDLGDAFFVDEAVDADLLRFAIIIDVFKQRIEFVHRIDRIGLAAGLRAA